MYGGSGGGGGVCVGGGEVDTITCETRDLGRHCYLFEEVQAGHAAGGTLGGWG